MNYDQKVQIIKAIFDLFFSKMVDKRVLINFSVVNQYTLEVSVRFVKFAIRNTENYFMLCSFARRRRMFVVD